MYVNSTLLISPTTVFAEGQNNFGKYSLYYALSFTNEDKYYVLPQLYI